MYTARRLSDMGESLSSGKLANSSLARLWKKIKETRKPFAVDVAFYQPSGTASWFIGVPVIVPRTRPGARHIGFASGANNYRQLHVNLGTD